MQNYFIDKFSFGKYKGTALKDVPDSDSDYLYWTLDNLDAGHDTSKEFAKHVQARISEIENKRQGEKNGTKEKPNRLSPVQMCLPI